jgi:hypothetical protein
MPAANQLRLDDGFSTIITLANLPNVKLYEKTVTPPGMTAGGPIDTTTMRNIAWRTSSPKQLKSLTPAKAEVAYATEAYPEIFGQIAVVQLITVTFPDGASLEFYGWLEEFTPGANTEGEQPKASISIQVGNRDANGAEVAPVYNDPAESS